MTFVNGYIIMSYSGLVKVMFNTIKSAVTRNSSAESYESYEKQRTKIIVGLGNPGSKYNGTRHNVGFDCIDKLAQRWNIPLSDKRQNAVLGEGEVEGVNVVLAKPRTYMNNSGEAVRSLMVRFRVELADLAIIYDEMDLPPGTIRLRPRGGTAGHKGVTSIVDALGSNRFPRVRVGIGKPENPTDKVEYALGIFNTEEQQMVEEVVDRVADSVDSLVHDGIDRAMNVYNTPPPKRFASITPF